MGARAAQQELRREKTGRGTSAAAFLPSPSQRSARNALPARPEPWCCWPGFASLASAQRCLRPLGSRALAFSVLRVLSDSLCFIRSIHRFLKKKVSPLRLPRAVTHSAQTVSPVQPPSSGNARNGQCGYCPLYQAERTVPSVFLICCWEGREQEWSCGETPVYLNSDSPTPTPPPSGLPHVEK